MCRAALKRRGFRTTERPFEYSSWPGRYGTPTAGVVLALTGFWLAWEAWSGTISLAMMVGTVILLLVAMSGWWFGKAGTVTFPFLRQRAINLEAAPSGTDTPPAVWLVAHLDSKSQSVPMLLRIAGVVLCAIAWVVLLALWAATTVVTVSNELFIGAALGSAIGALPLIGTLVGARGDGALDNASGVATVLAALDLIEPGAPVGLLITSAEELGLAGARAWVRQYRRHTTDSRARSHSVIINCDSIDDCGELVCMLSATVARHLHDPLRAASLASHVTPAIRRVIPGVLVDAIAFTQAGYPALTVSRGRWRSLARVHTRHDDLRHMTGAGIVEAARFIAELVKAITDKRMNLRSIDLHTKEANPSI